MHGVDEPAARDCEAETIAEAAESAARQQWDVNIQSDKNWCQTA
jgi:hypothetical protein